MATNLKMRNVWNRPWRREMININCILKIKSDAATVVHSIKLPFVNLFIFLYYVIRSHLRKSVIRGNEFNMGCECAWADRILSLPCLYRLNTSYPCTSALFSAASHRILGHISQVSAREAEAKYTYKSHTHTHTHTHAHTKALS